MKNELILILNNIRSAHNVGSIFRTADASGVSKIYLCGYTPTPVKDLAKIHKTALGAEQVVPWEHFPKAWRLVKKLKESSVTIVALELSARAVDYRKYKVSYPMALILGNEVDGLSPTVLRYCDAVVQLPMKGTKESLNVSVAAGIALYKFTEKN